MGRHLMRRVDRPVREPLPYRMPDQSLFGISGIPSIPVSARIPMAPQPQREPRRPVIEMERDAQRISTIQTHAAMLQSQMSGGVENPAAVKRRLKELEAEKQQVLARLHLDTILFAT